MPTRNPLLFPLVRGTVAAVVERCSLESVGAIHESPAVGTTDNAPHQAPLSRGGRGVAQFILSSSFFLLYRRKKENSRFKE